jgi:hypothetical protein
MAAANPRRFGSLTIATRQLLLDHCGSLAGVQMGAGRKQTFAASRTALN